MDVEGGMKKKEAKGGGERFPTMEVCRAMGWTSSVF